MTDEYQANLRVQYEQCFLHMRAHMQAVWQVPVTTIAVAGGLILGAFQFGRTRLIIEVVLIFGCVLLFALLVSLIKHDFYYRIERETLTVLETEMQLKHMQELPYKDIEKKMSKEHYWYTDEGSWLEKQSAARFLKGAMGLILILLATVVVITALTSPLPWFDP